jgi:uncharacterized protein YkwD
MSTGSSALGSVLSGLTEANQIIVLATQVGSVLVPVIKGTVAEIKHLVQGETISYQVVIQTGDQNIADANQAAFDTIDLVNAERAKAGLPPLEKPAATPPDNGSTTGQ